MAISTRQVKNKRDSNGVLTGRPGTVYDVNIKYTAPNGEKKTYSKKGFPTKKEATQHEAEMKAKLHNPGQIASIASQRKQTVASYLNEWVESYARVNLRPSTYDGYKRTIANYITPYIGGVALNQLTPAMVDKMFQQIIDKGLKPSTAAGAKRVLSVALSHARKYRYIETNAAKDTLTKFGKLLEDLDMPHIRFHDLRHPYVKHTTKKFNSEKQKTQATKMDLIAWGFCFCIVSYSKRSWTL